MSHAAPMRTSRGFSAARMRTTPTATNGARIHARNNVAVMRERNINRANTNTLRNSRMEAGRTANANAAAQTANANAKFGPRANVAAGRNGNISGTTTQAAIPQRNAPIVNNWQNVSGQNYAAFRDYRQQWHDRNWWQNNYSRIILVGGGWWYWNDGYWYPAPGGTIHTTPITRMTAHLWLRRPDSRPGYRERANAITKRWLLRRAGRRHSWTANAPRDCGVSS